MLDAVKYKKLDELWVKSETQNFQVLSHYVTVDIILTMANHQDPSVRTSIVKLLSNICNRVNESVHNNAAKFYHWHHLANQISLHKVDVNLVTSIVQWTTSRTTLGFSLEQLVSV